MATDSGRTIVFSDVHGEPGLIRAVVEHSGFDASRDRLVFAGDAIELGRDSWGCLELLDQLGAELLVGNHEYAAFVGWHLESGPIDERVRARVNEGLASGRWRLAAHADGVLITHAGVSSDLLADFENAGAGTVERFVDALNEEFAGTVELGLLATEGAIDVDGPLWYRPCEQLPPLPDVTQVAGHTPPELLALKGGEPARWEATGLHLIDPYVRGWRARRYADPPPLRYAVIADGTVTVVDPRRDSRIFQLG